MRVTRFSEDRFNELIKRYFAFRSTHPYSAQSWSVNSPNAIECKDILHRIAEQVQMLVEDRRLLGDQQFRVQIPQGQGNYPRKHWIAILSDDEEVSNGVYPLIGFTGEICFYVGCAHSYTNQAIEGWERFINPNRFETAKQRDDFERADLLRDKNLAIPASVFFRNSWVSEQALSVAIKKAIDIRREVRKQRSDSPILSVSDEGVLSINDKKLNSLDGRIEALDNAIVRIENKQAEVLAKSGTGVEEIERLRSEINVVKQTVKDAREEINASVAKAIKKAQEDTNDFVQSNQARLNAALSELAELKTAYTVDSLAKQLDAKRKEEEDSLRTKSRLFYGALGCFAIIGFVAVGLSLGAVTDSMKEKYGLLAYLIPMPKNLIRIAPFSLPLIWVTCHFAKLVAQSRRLMEEYAHKVVVAKTYMGVANEVDAMFEKHITDAAQLRSDLMRTLINTIGSNPNTSLDKIKNTTPLSEVSDCVARLATAVKDVRSPAVG